VFTPTAGCGWESGSRLPQSKEGKAREGGRWEVEGLFPEFGWVDALCNFELDGGFYGLAVFGVGHAEPGFFGGNDLEGGLVGVYVVADDFGEKEFGFGIVGVLFQEVGELGFEVGEKAGLEAE